MKRLRYVGDKPFKLTYDSHGNACTVMLKAGEWYVLPVDNGEVKRLVANGGLVATPERGAESEERPAFAEKATAGEKGKKKKDVAVEAAGE